MSAMGAVSDQDVRSSELKLFLDMLMAERGAAAHTITAYTTDLAAFLASPRGAGKTRFR
nr:site-specific integrase [Methyloligella halotolerans]